MIIRVLHAHYGCETGCCGHEIEVDGERKAFDFDHASGDEDPIEFAKRLLTDKLGEEHVKDLDWENCKVVSYDGCTW